MTCMGGATNYTMGGACFDQVEPLRPLKTVSRSGYKYSQFTQGLDGKGGEYRLSIIL